MDTAWQEDEHSGGIRCRAPKTPPGMRKDVIITLDEEDPPTGASHGARTSTTRTAQAQARSSDSRKPPIEGRARAAAPPLAFYTGTPKSGLFEIQGTVPRDDILAIRPPTAAELVGVSEAAIRLAADECCHRYLPRPQ
jgi:hypothetical protein